MSTFGIIHRFAGGTKEQYEASIARVQPPDGGLPKGQTYHAAGATDDGWVVVALWDSRESWESFRDETLTPGSKPSAMLGSLRHRSRRSSRFTRRSGAPRRFRARPIRQIDGTRKARKQAKTVATRCHRSR